MDRIENTAYNGSSILATGTYLSNRRLTTLGGHTDNRRKDDLIRAVLFLNKESRLKHVQYQGKCDSSILRWLLDRLLTQILYGLQTVKTERVGSL
jgi:hypothetical protein